MTTDLERHRPRTPLVGASRRALARGLLTERALLELVSLECPWATAEQLGAELRAHPGVFRMKVDRWELVPEAPRVLRHARPQQPFRPMSQRPYAEPMRGQTGDTPAPKRSSGQSAAAPVPVYVPAANLTVVGLRVVVDLPADRSPVSDLGEVELWVPGAEGSEPVFLGTRTVIATIDLRPAVQRSRLVLAPAQESAHVLDAPSRLAIEARESGGGSVQLLRDWEDSRLSLLSAEALATLATVCRPSRGTAPLTALLGEAGRQKRLLRDDPHGQWARIGEWFATLRDVSPSDLEKLLLVFSDAGPSEAAGIALDLLGGFPPVNVGYCAAFAQLMARLGRPGALDYAKALLAVIRTSGEDPAVDVHAVDHASGWVAWSEDRYEDAVRLWLGIPDYLDDEDRATLQLAATECAGQWQRAVLVQLRRWRDDGDPGAVELEAQAISDFRHLPVDEQVHGVGRVLIDLIDRGCVDDAWRRYDAFVSDARIGHRQRLDLLSIFELAPSEHSAIELLLKLDRLFREVDGGLGLPLLRDLLPAVELVERALGYSPSTSSAIRQSIQRLAPDPEPEPAPSLRDVRVCLVGGRPGGAVRIQGHLEELGAAVVHIPAHWDAHVDQRGVEERAANATHLVLLTDVCGHQEQDILRNVSRKRAIPLVFTAGGPSRVARDLTARRGEGHSALPEAGSRREFSVQ